MVSRHSHTPADLPSTLHTDRPPSQKNPAEENRPTAFLWLTRTDQWLVVSVAVVVVILLAEKWQRLRYIERPQTIVHRVHDDISYQIDLNSATWIELTQLRGIGSVMAHRIVENREEFGPFRSVDDLQRVKGIGPKTLEKNRRWIRVEPLASSSK